MQVVNLQVTPSGVNPIIHVSQFDVGRQFQLKLYDGPTAYQIPSGAVPRIEGIKPDQHGFSYTDAVSVSGNTITVTTNEQMTIVSGTVECEIRFAKQGIDVGSINFKMLVEESPINETTDISETDLPEIFALATEQMENAEAWAKGTKNGVAVGSSEPQYHNNSKYWNEQTHLMDQDAEAWANGTRNGTAIGSSDPAYQKNAKYWKDQANAQANNSAASATLSQSWAVGGTNTRPGEDTNNSMYYANRADQVGAQWGREAEAWAIGERNGVPVVSGDETYENNSKYYCNESKDVLQHCEDALTSISAYYALIRLIMGTVYIQTEAGLNLITESGDSIIVDY